MLQFYPGCKIPFVYIYTGFVAKNTCTRQTKKHYFLYKKYWTSNLKNDIKKSALFYADFFIPQQHDVLIF